MHLRSARAAQRKTGSQIYHVTDFEERMVLRHDLLYVHPQGETNPDRILGYFATRRIILTPPRPNIVKSGSIGYRKGSDVSAIISGAIR